MGFFYARTEEPVASAERSKPMTCNPSQVVITTEDLKWPAVHASFAHHRDFPEVRGEGESPADAAARLVDQLSAALDNAPSDWRRQGIRRAIEDVQAFVEQSRH
jgi:hypothetical protein